MQFYVVALETLVSLIVSGRFYEKVEHGILSNGKCRLRGI